MKLIVQLVFTCIVFFGLVPRIGAQITGYITDEDNNSLTGVSIFLPDHQTGTTTDLNGKFELEVRNFHSVRLIISYIGFESKEMMVNYFSKPYDIGHIQLVVKSEMLDLLTVSEKSTKDLYGLDQMNVSAEFFEKYNQGTFAQSLENIAGISAINVGTGIAKPVIRGLSSNRVILTKDGIKQESQQWGADHGLEIDPFDVEKVEIIKGPASIQYGSDGLGGIIRIVPGEIPKINTLKGGITSVFKSNNNHIGGSAFVSGNKENIFFSARYTQQHFGDYKVPTDQFIYNGFYLPIYDNTLVNTAGIEKNTSLSIGFAGEKSIHRLSFSHYDFEGGLFAGAVGIPRSYQLQPDNDKRNIVTPSQKTDHYRLTVTSDWTLGSSLLKTNLGYQKNKRNEYSRPDFHNVPAGTNDINNHLANQLILETYSFNALYIYALGRGKMTHGGDVQWQNNTRGGFSFLIPDFMTLRSGLFSMYQWSGSKLDYTTGARIDFGNNKTALFSRNIWDSNGNVIDSLVVVATDNNFYNWSASFGLHYPVSEKSQLKWNLAKSFRIPYPSETSSNGIHHGSFRHEVGSSELTAESGWQTDVNYQWDNKNISLDLSFYFNFFEDYIYLGPSFPARFSNLPEAGQIYLYQQNDAIYTGIEFDWSYTFKQYLKFRQTFDYVQSVNINTSIALPFTPQPSLKNEISWSPKLGNDNKIDLTMEAVYKYYFAAEGISRIDRSERPTPATGLFDVRFLFDFKLGREKIQFNFQILNVFDTYYLNHLSRYRLINIPEQGRNFVLSVKIPIVSTERL